MDEFMHERMGKTMVNYEEEHGKLWNWLADHPEATKRDYFKDWDRGRVPQNQCFACEAAYSCQFCPLGGDPIMGCCGGLYVEWATALTPETRRKLARKIANLPWKEVGHEADQL